LPSQPFHRAKTLESANAKSSREDGPRKAPARREKPLGRKKPKRAASMDRLTRPGPCGQAFAGSKALKWGMTTRSYADSPA